MTSAYNYCFVTERTDTGCVRKANEDNLVHFECKNGLVATVCDGMGGHVGGAVASQVAVDAIQQFLTENYFDSPFEAIGMAIDAANKAILNRTRTQPELQGMGATCVMLIVRDGKVYMGSVGDSRIYLIRNRHIMQMTKDQSFVQMLVDRGEITKEQAESHPRKNEITNCLGIEEMQAATVLPEAFIPEAGDCFLLCSDGLSGMVSDKKIEHIVSKQAEMSSQQRVDTLVEMAKQNGGLDNITVQIVEFAVSPAAVQKKPFPKKWHIIGACALVVIIASVLTFLLLPKGGEDNTGQISDQQSEETKKVTTATKTIPVVRIVRFENVPFTKDTKLYIKEGLQFDTVCVQSNLREPKCETQTIAKLGNLFDQLKGQANLNLTYDKGIFNINALPKCKTDTLAFVLENDSIKYQIEVIKVKKEVSKPATATTTAAPGNNTSSVKAQIVQAAKDVTSVKRVETGDRTAGNHEGNDEGDNSAVSDNSEGSAAPADSPVISEDVAKTESETPTEGAKIENVPDTVNAATREEQRDTTTQK